MNVLELFAGSRSIGRVAEKMGHTVFSVDIEKFDGINLVKDIEYLTTDDIPFIPDMIWASPPCTSYSIAGISHHRDGIKPMSLFAEKSDRVICNVLRLTNEYNCLFYLENPRGMLRKMPFMKNIARTTVCYCKYGDTRMKPTDIFSNNIYNLFNPYGWSGKMCSNNNTSCHHEPSPRGSKTGTQGLKNNYERSKIPEKLVIEILEATKEVLITPLVELNLN